ncbi:hypothetical protein [Thalassospira sp.]|uniref:hypothetical protein n=1 Tax=Thalassospira sp. TaxID=1912094 RepID=UPI001B116A8D|nr:hypothetical protein [Thalassospira sp.]MBO6807270.1 hypothetical protein [Thalassospira sp.]MBO6841677.1 hypothetical protein [Thalassospira sp.]
MDILNSREDFEKFRAEAEKLNIRFTDATDLTMENLSKITFDGACKRVGADEMALFLESLSDVLDEHDEEFEFEHTNLDHYGAVWDQILESFACYCNTIMQIEDLPNLKARIERMRQKLA